MRTNVILDFSFINNFLFSFFIFFVGFGLSSIEAEDIPLSEVPPLHQVRIFQSELTVDHYIVVGKDKNYADTGRYYVLDVRPGLISSPQLKKDSFFWFGGGFDFWFESGQWFYVPAGNSGVTAPGATNEVLQAGIVDPNLGREPLQSVAVTLELIERLGIKDKIHLEFLERLEKPSETQPKRKTPDERVVLFVVEYNSKDEEDRDLRRSLRNHLQDTGERAIEVQDVMGRDNSVLYIWAFETQAPVIEAAILEYLGKKPLKRERAFSRSSEAKVVTSLDELDAVEGHNSLNSIAASFEAFKVKASQGVSVFTDDEIFLIYALIHRLEWIVEMNNRPAYSLQHYWEGSEDAQHSFAKNFSVPMSELLMSGYEILAKVDSPLARRVLLFSGKDKVLRAPMMLEPAGKGPENYFQIWARLLAEQAAWIKTSTEEEREDLRVASNIGGILPNFGFMSVGVKDHSPKRNDWTWQLDDVENMYPLLALGLSDSPSLRLELVRLVINLDKSAEYQKQHFATQYDGEILGSLMLMRVLHGLVYTAPYKSDTKQINGFSRELYYAQAMNVVSELLNTSRVTITNSASYLIILDVAVSLQKYVQEEFGIVPNAHANTPELNQLTEELIRLNQAVQVRMIRGVFLGSESRPKDCAAVLKAF